MLLKILPFIALLFLLAFSFSIIGCGDSKDDNEAEGNTEKTEQTEQQNNGGTVENSAPAGSTESGKVDFEGFFNEFKSALLAGDEAAMDKLMQFPFMMTGSPMTKEEFVNARDFVLGDMAAAYFKELGDTPLAKLQAESGYTINIDVSEVTYKLHEEENGYTLIISEAMPIEGEDFVDESALIYVFEESENGYLFVGFDAAG